MERLFTLVIQNALPEKPEVLLTFRTSVSVMPPCISTLLRKTSRLAPINRFEKAVSDGAFASQWQVMLAYLFEQESFERFSTVIDALLIARVYDPDQGIGSLIEISPI